MLVDHGLSCAISHTSLGVSVCVNYIICLETVDIKIDIKPKKQSTARMHLTSFELRLIISGNWLPHVNLNPKSCLT